MAMANPTSNACEEKYQHTDTKLQGRALESAPLVLPATTPITQTDTNTPDPHTGTKLQGRALQSAPLALHAANPITQTDTNTPDPHTEHKHS